jgi:hypothetical protein
VNLIHRLQSVLYGKIRDLLTVIYKQSYFLR